MRRNVLQSAVCLLAAVFTLVASSAAPAYAATAPKNTKGAGNGLRISPVRTDITVSPGETKTVDITLENITSIKATVSGIVNDFVASDDESGTPKILLDANKSAPSHGLKQYVKAIGNVTINPGEQKNISVTIAIPKSAAGGGYFGAVRFVPADDDTSRNVSLSASIGSLFLVTVPGNLKEHVELQSFNVRRDEKASSFYTSGNNLKATLRLKNDGNVQVAPFGKIIIKKNGKQVGEVEANNVTPRGSILPDSIRKFDVDLQNKTTSFGKYTLEGNFGYGSSGQLISAKTTFYVIPWWMIALVGGVILLIILALFVPKMVREHDRQVLGRGKRK